MMTDKHFNNIVGDVYQGTHRDIFVIGIVIFMLFLNKAHYCKIALTTH